MKNLKKIMSIKNANERYLALREYALKLGVSVSGLPYDQPETNRNNEPELISRIKTVERHNLGVRLTVISIIIAAIGVIWLGVDALIKK